MKRVMLDKEAVEKLFREAKSQEEYLVGLFKMVFPNWYDIKQIGQWPVCNEKTWKWICQLCMDADERLKLDVMKGGAWLDKGFSTATLPDYAVEYDESKLPYFGDEHATLQVGG